MGDARGLRGPLSARPVHVRGTPMGAFRGLVPELVREARFEVAEAGVFGSIVYAWIAGRRHDRARSGSSARAHEYVRHAPCLVLAHVQALLRDEYELGAAPRRQRDAPYYGADGTAVLAVPDQR